MQRLQQGGQKMSWQIVWSAMLLNQLARNNPIASTSAPTTITNAYL